MTRLRPILLLILGLLTGLSFSIALAWVDPTAAPPAGNAPAPINVSDTAQTKTGGLNIATTSGNVGIGTTGALSKLSVLITTTGDGIRLVGAAGVSPGFLLYDTSARGALGLAEAAGAWSSSAAVGDIVLRADTGKLLLQNGAGAANLTLASGSVGVGTDSPGAKMEIVSGVQNTLRLRKTAGIAGSIELFPAVGDGTSRTGTALCQTVSATSLCLGYWASSGTLSTC